MAALHFFCTAAATQDRQAPAPMPASATIEAPSRAEPFAITRQAVVAKIRDRILQGIDRTDPTANLWLRIGATTKFDGSYDWHSCIAAHWAGLSMGRLLGDDALAAKFVARLPLADLAAELDRLPKEVANDDAGSRRLRSGVEMVRPYADAWFVLLLAELGEHKGIDKTAVMSLRAKAEDALLLQLEQGEFPEIAKNVDPGTVAQFSGGYRSWLFGYLALSMTGPSNDAAKTRMSNLRKGKLDPARELLRATRKSSPRDFLDLTAIHALVERMESVDTIAPVERSFRELPATLPSIREIHPVGAAISETWPFALAASKHEQSRAIFASRMDQILAREDLWAEDFAVSSHWLPQFLWFGMHLEITGAVQNPVTAAPLAEAAAKAKPKPKMTPMPKPGTPAPWFPMTDRDGKAVTLEQYAGKVVILDFWATWCGPCKQAMPHLQHIAKAYADQGVVVVASCTNDERAKFDAWVDEQRSTLPDIVFVHDEKGRSDDRGSLKAYGVMMIPVTFVIDREGKIAKAVGGYTPGEVLVDAALAKAGITVPAEILEKAKQDEEARKARSKAPKPAAPAKPGEKPASGGV